MKFKINSYSLSFSESAPLLQNGLHKCICIGKSTLKARFATRKFENNADWQRR